MSCTVCLVSKKGFAIIRNVVPGLSSHGRLFQATRSCRGQHPIGPRECGWQHIWMHINGLDWDGRFSRIDSRADVDDPGRFRQLGCLRGAGYLPGSRDQLLRVLRDADRSRTYLMLRAQLSHGVHCIPGPYRRTERGSCLGRGHDKSWMAPTIIPNDATCRV